MPFTSPSRVTASRPTAFATPKSRMRATPSTPTTMFWGETSRWTTPSGVPSSIVASCAAWSPASAPIATAIVIGTGTTAPRSADARISRASDSPWMYSMTRKSSPSVDTTSSVAATLG